jgi:hypothetical protein
VGGRRAGSLGKLVGTGGDVAGAKRDFSRAVSREDPEAIAGASARVIASSTEGLHALAYGLKLTQFISDQASQLKRLGPKNRDERIRRAWAEIKQRDGITTPREIDNAVVSAANEALTKKKRGPR